MRGPLGRTTQGSVQVPGGRLHFDAQGRGRIPLVFVHGYCGSRLDFTPGRPELARRTRVVRFDQRGHGRSSRASRYSLAALVADLGVALEQLGAPRVDLLGHSMGGMVALRLALRRPERVRSLILAGTTPDPLPLEPPTLGRPGLRARLRARAARTLGRDPAARLAAELSGGGRARAAFLRATRAAHRAVDPKAVRDLAHDMGRVDPVGPLLDRLELPVTVVVGAADARFLAPSRALAERLPGARLVVVDGAGHFPQFEAPQAWLAALLNHLERVGGR